MKPISEKKCLIISQLIVEKYFEPITEGSSNEPMKKFPIIWFQAIFNKLPKKNSYKIAGVNAKKMQLKFSNDLQPKE